MIATILYSSPTFEGVDYNERKVAQGSATQLVRENFGYLEGNKDATSESLRQYLQDYSRRNERIQKPQLHVAFSCKGQEMSTDELVTFARSWLVEMGYNHPQQPLLIYSHNDTDNNHIHVITSRVDPIGKKVDHSHERVRSKAFVERTLGVDTKKAMNEVLMRSFGYKYASLSQWKAILESSGYAVAEQGDELKIAKNGAYAHTLSKKEVEERISRKEDYVDKRRAKQIKALLLKYRGLSCEKEELQAMMKRKFGMDLVFLGAKDSPRGYFLVDHKEQKVYKGSELVKLDQLLAFEAKEVKLQRIDAFIDAQLEERPRLTSRDLNTLLKKHYDASYREGKVYFGQHEWEIQPYMIEALRYNDRVELINGYSYATSEERVALGQHFRVREEDMSTETASSTPRQTKLLGVVERAISDKNTLSDRLSAIRRQELEVVAYNDKYIVLDKQEKTVCCLDNHGISLSQPVQKQSTRQQSKFKQKRNNTGVSSANREWEVGSDGRYNDIDDERRLKR